jgi:isopentenyl-diphosphate delta-isomerase type 1
MEEWFDVVDSEDRVVGRATRAVVHARGLLHRAVHILVFNKVGEVFLQKRSFSKDSSPGLWDSSASGHLDVGEDYDAAAVRELGEEIGLQKIPKLERLFYLKAQPDTGQEFVWVYRLDHEGPFLLNPAEIDEGRWVSPDELSNWIESQPDAFAVCFRLVWATWQETSSTCRK